MILFNNINKQLFDWWCQLQSVSWKSSKSLALQLFESIFNQVDLTRKLVVPL